MPDPHCGGDSPTPTQVRPLVPHFPQESYASELTAWVYDFDPLGLQETSLNQSIDKP